jgi:phosphatidylinositol glycan class F
MSTTNPPKATVPAKTSLPVELLPTDLARIVSQAHPALLLSAYYLRFSALVADPVPTLLNSLLPLALIQIAYAIICLPAVGSNSKPVKKAKLGASKKTTDASSAKGLVSINFFYTS